MAQRSDNENFPRFQVERGSETTGEEGIRPPEFKQFLDRDFPEAGEIAIPCVGPLTIHVISLLCSF